MRRTDPTPFDQAVAAVRDDLPDTAHAEAAAGRVGDRLRELGAFSAAGVETHAGADDATLQGCAGVAALLPAFVAGELPEARALLVEDHTRGCISCRRELIALRSGDHAEAPPSVAGWTAAGRAHRSASGEARGRRPLLAAAAVVAVALGLAAVLALALGLVPGGTAAEVAAVDGALYLVTDSGPVPITAGQEVERGQEVRTATDSRAILELADGSRVELAPRSELAVWTGRRDTTLELSQGSVIVEAARRARGHLYVDTDECRVAVTGTIFAVDHGIKGSRVSVAEGSVRVEHGRQQEMLRPGDQVTTRTALAAMPVAHAFAWSGDAERYLALLTELSALREDLRAAVPAPGPRYSTRLLDAAPAGTAIYVALPNIGDDVLEARRVFKERLAASPLLAEALGDAGAAEEIDHFVERLAAYGAFLGDEIVVALVADPAATDGELGGPVLLAEALDPAGLRAQLESDIAADGELRLVDDPATATGEGPFVWIADGLVVAAADGRHLALAAAGGFAGSDFHRALVAAYADGVEWLGAVELSALTELADEDDRPPELSGFADARYALARWSDSSDHPSGAAEVVFGGERTGVASWLAAPAPMGSLEFVSADAAAAAVVLVRQPAEIVDELLGYLLETDADTLADLERIQREEGFDLRADLAEPLGGEIAFAIDGPLAPSPAWKVVVEVYDPARFQTTLGWAVGRLEAAAAEGGEPTGYRIEETSRGGRTLYTLRTPEATAASAATATWTYTDSYLVAAPSVALVERALAVRAAGTHLGTAATFRALLPTDGYTEVSALVFQDLGSKLAPLAERVARLEGLSEEQRTALAAAEELAPPALGYARAGRDRIAFTGTLGGENLSIAALLGSGGTAGGLGALVGLAGLTDDGLGSVAATLEAADGAAADAADAAVATREGRR